MIDDYPMEEHHFLVPSTPSLEPIEDIIADLRAYRLLDQTQERRSGLLLDMTFLAGSKVGPALGVLPSYRYYLRDHTKADAPNKPIWAWDAKLKQYRHLASGKIIGPKRMLELRDLYTDRQALRAEGLTAQLVKGEISLQDWLLAQRKLIKETYLSQYAMARGGRSQMTPQDYGRLGADLKKQYTYLQAFGHDIQAGKYRSDDPANLIARIANRIKLYIESATQAFEKGKVAVFGGNLYDHITNFPGAGKTRCLTRCRCHLAVTETETEWLVRWVLDPAAEHCEDCISLGEKWNPLRVAKPEVKATLTVGQGTGHETTHDTSTGQFAPKNGGSKPAAPPAAPQRDLDYEHLRENVQVATERERLDMYEGFAQQRIDLENNRQAQIEETRINHQNYLEDQENGFDESVRETAIRQAQQRADVERRLAQQRADRLTRYQRQVRDAKKDAARDAEDLASSRDAVGFLKRSKARDEALLKADRQLNDALADFDTQAARTREKLDTSQEREIATLTRQQQDQMERAAAELKRAMATADREYNRQVTRQERGQQRAEKAYTIWAKRIQEDAETSYKEHLKKREKETKKKDD